MRASIRPYVTAGVALVGASVIAVTPIQPAAAAAAVPVANTAVQLAAAPSPFEVYPQVIERTAENVATLVETYFADPFPIITATIENQLVDLADAVTALEAGDGSAAFASLLDAVMQPLRIPAAWGTAFQEKVDMSYGGWALLTFFGSAIAGFAATGGALMDVYEAAVTFDLIGVVNAVVNIPARIIDGVLNGVIPLGTGFFPGGLLSHGNIAGPVDVLTELDQSTGDKLRSSSPDASPPVEEPPSDLSPADQESPALAAADTTIQSAQDIDTAGAETINDDLDSGEGVPIIVEEVAENDLSDQEEPTEAVEVAVAEDAIEELTDENESAAGQDTTDNEEAEPETGESEADPATDNDDDASATENGEHNSDEPSRPTVD